VKKVITIAALVMAALSITASSALASPGPVSTGKQACKASGPAVVNVRYTYTTVDSGLAATSGRTTSSIASCRSGRSMAATARLSLIVTVDGASPGNTGVVSAGITGKLKGGYTATLLQGTLDSSKPTRGNLGSFGIADKPSFMSYGLSGDLADWGWVYETESNGTWINASTGTRHHRLRRNDQTAREGRRKPPFSLRRTLAATQLRNVPRGVSFR
jgi:hypothetical protein